MRGSERLSQLEQHDSDPGAETIKGLPAHRSGGGRQSYPQKALTYLQDERRGRWHASLRNVGELSLWSRGLLQLSHLVLIGHFKSKFLLHWGQNAVQCRSCHASI